jgi:hypothetical protein
MTSNVGNKISLKKLVKIVYKIGYEQICATEENNIFIPSDIALLFHWVPN